MRLVVLAFITVPIVEMIILIQVGTVVGVLATVFLVMLTAMIGVALLRAEGFATWQRLQARLHSGELPGLELLEGAMLLVGGALLLTPGFLTDSLGFCLIVPFVRTPIARRLLRHLRERASAASGVIDGDFTEHR